MEHCKALAGNFNGRSVPTLIRSFGLGEIVAFPDRFQFEVLFFARAVARRTRIEKMRCGD
jgi:hypothetical protein